LPGVYIGLVRYPGEIVSRVSVWGIASAIDTERPWTRRHRRKNVFKQYYQLRVHDALQHHILRIPLFYDFLLNHREELWFVRGFHSFPYREYQKRFLCAWQWHLGWWSQQ
jgi:hypothetical protein